MLFPCLVAHFAHGLQRYRIPTSGLPSPKPPIPFIVNIHFKKRSLKGNTSLNSGRIVQERAHWAVLTAGEARYKRVKSAESAEILLRAQDRNFDGFDLFLHHYRSNQDLTVR